MAGPSGGGGAAAAGAGSGAAAYGAAAAGAASNGSSAGSSYGSQSSQSNGASARSSSAMNLSQASFPTRGGSAEAQRGANQDSSRSGEQSLASLDLFSGLTIPSRASSLMAEMTNLRGAEQNSQAIREVYQQLSESLEAQRVLEADKATEQVAKKRSGRAGPTLEQNMPQATDRSLERGQVADERRSQAADKGQQSGGLSLSSESFSQSMSQVRDAFSDKQPQDAERRPDEMRQDPVDEEEELTRRLLQKLDDLVSSNEAGEGLASYARGKRGRDLAAAVGVVASKMEQHKEESRRSRRDAPQDSQPSVSYQSAEQEDRRRREALEAQAA